MQGDIVSLNVGGIIYTTTRSTLLSADSNQDNYFTSLLSERFPVLKDNQGNIFIDRDGKNFRYIINYLRGGSLHVTEANPAQARLIFFEIIDESLFFGLDVLTSELQRRIDAIEEDENRPKINNVVTELQRLQRQLKRKTPKKRLNEGVEQRGLPTTPSDLQQHQQQHQQQQQLPFTPSTFDLNIPFWNIQSFCTYNIDLHIRN